MFYLDNALQGRCNSASNRSKGKLCSLDFICQKRLYPDFLMILVVTSRESTLVSISGTWQRDREDHCALERRFNNERSGNNMTLGNHCPTVGRTISVVQIHTKVNGRKNKPSIKRSRNPTRSGRMVLNLLAHATDHLVLGGVLCAIPPHSEVDTSFLLGGKGEGGGGGFYLEPVANP